MLQKLHEEKYLSHQKLSLSLLYTISIMLSHSHTNCIPHMQLMRRMSQGSVWERMNSYLPGVGVYSDHEGCSPSMSLYHCTTIEMTAAITQHLSNSFAQFLVVGACVRACPFQNNKHKRNKKSTQKRVSLQQFWNVFS